MPNIVNDLNWIRFGSHFYRIGTWDYADIEFGNSFQHIGYCESIHPAAFSGYLETEQERTFLADIRKAYLNHASYTRSMWLNQSTCLQGWLEVTGRCIRLVHLVKLNHEEAQSYCKNELGSEIAEVHSWEQV